MDPVQATYPLLPATAAHPYRAVVFRCISVPSFARPRVAAATGCMAFPDAACGDDIYEGTRAAGKCRIPNAPSPTPMTRIATV